MTKEELKGRTKKFAVRIVQLARAMPRTMDSEIIAKQVLRSATSVAANYRATCRARSKAEFVSKLGVVVEEIDETVFWLEMIEETNILSASKMSELLREGNELLSIFTSSQLTAKGVGKKNLNPEIRQSGNAQIPYSGNP